MTTAVPWRPARIPSGTPLWELRADAFGRLAKLALVGGDPGLLEDARARLGELDALWRPGSSRSDLALLQRRSGVVVAVAPETVLLVALAVEAAGPTAGDGSPAYDDVVIDVRHGAVGLPPAAGLSLPDLAPALAADLVTADLVDAGAAGVLVTVGTASRAEGASPDRAGWLVRIGGHAHRLRRGGVAEGPDGAVVVADEAWQAWANARAFS